MADVANSIGTTPPGRSNSYATSPSSSTNSTLVSPSIVEAIDRIFPKSPSQLLPLPFSDSLGNKRSLLVTTAQSISSCTASTSCSTTDTATTATAVFTGLTASSGTTLPVMSLTPSQNDTPSLPARAKVKKVSSHSPINGTVDINLKPDLQGEFIAPKRRLRADVEIANNCSSDETLKNAKSGRQSLSDKELNGIPSVIELSDSDDMCRPFIKNKKEKKKKKKNLKLNEQKDAESETNSQSSPILTQPSKISTLTLAHQLIPPQFTSDDRYHEHSNTSDTPATEGCTNSYLNGSDTTVKDVTSCENLEISNLFRPSPTSDTIFRKRTDRQKLPRVKRCKYNLLKDSGRIPRVFPPCYVVLKKVDQLLLQMKDSDQNIAFDLSIKKRVQILSSLCAESKIKCAEKKKTIHKILSFNVLDDSTCGNSEDEFRIPQGRSLRKRRQDICYVEPSEDDLLDDLSLFSKKKMSKQSKTDQSGEPIEENSSSTKDSQSLKEMLSQNSSSTVSVNEADSKSKKRKKSSAQSSEHGLVVGSETGKRSSQSEHSMPNAAILNLLSGVINKDSNDTNKGNTVSINNTKSGIGPSLVYVYPKTSVASDTTAISPNKANDKGTKKSSSVKITRPSPAHSQSVIRPLSDTSFPAATTLNLVPNSAKQSIPIGLFGTAFGASSSSSSSSLSLSIPQNVPMLGTNTNISSFTQKGNKNLPANMCMVKIDGKDYLLSLPAASSSVAAPLASGQLRSTSAATIPISQPGMLSAAGTRFMLYQPSGGVMPALRPAELSQGIAITTNGSTAPSLTIPRFSTSISLPGRVPSTAMHMLPTSLPLNASALSSATLLGGTQVSISTTTTSASVSSAQSIFCTPSSMLRSAAPAHQLPSATLSSTNSSARIFPSSLQSTSSVITTTTGSRHVRSLVAPIIAPGSTTVAPRLPGQFTANTATTAVQLVAPNSSVSGGRCFRIIVPACSATGSAARIATLGTSAISAMSSPLTRLTASSTLLPQRKQSVDKDMTPEKRAARRRKLEKKYPLPPGVVIKTEPLDTPQTSPAAQPGTVRSLLSSQNIQLIAASSRSGAGGIQRFRIISPNNSGVMVGARPVRFGNNVIIRAPMISGSSSASRILSSFSPALPHSSSLLTALSSSLALTSSTTTSSTSSAISSSITASTTAKTSGPTFMSSALRDAMLSTTAATTLTESVSKSVTSGARGTITLLSPSKLLLSSSMTTGTTSLSSSRAGVISSAAKSVDTFLTSSHNTAVVSSLSSNDDSLPQAPANCEKDQPTSVITTTPIACSSSSRPSGDSGAVVEIETTRQAIEKLHKLISAQEANGLQGARLDKLKEVLAHKKIVLLQLEQELEKTQNRLAHNQANVTDPVVID